MCSHSLRPDTPCHPCVLPTQNSLPVCHSVHTGIFFTRENDPRSAELRPAPFRHTYPRPASVTVVFFLPHCQCIKPQTTTVSYRQVLLHHTTCSHIGCIPLKAAGGDDYPLGVLPHLDCSLPCCAGCVQPGICVLLGPGLLSVLMLQCVAQQQPGIRTRIIALHISKQTVWWDRNLVH